MYDICINKYKYLTFILYKFNGIKNFVRDNGIIVYTFYFFSEMVQKSDFVIMLPCLSDTFLERIFLRLFMEQV